MLEYIGLRISTALTGVESLRAHLRRDEGQTLVEYALILVTVSIGVILAMTFLKENIESLFNYIGTKLGEQPG